MAHATATKTTTHTTPRLRLVRDREHALSQARAARRKLEGRQQRQQASDRFAYLRTSHD